MRFLLLSVLALGAAGCLDDTLPPDPSATQFIANASDFDGFTSWSFAREMTSAIPGQGSVTVFANMPAPAAGTATEFPRGMMIVKVIGDVSAAPSTWQAHAMVKRGGSYGSGAAPGWEFFDLGVTDEMRVVIRGRGQGTMTGTYVDPSGGTSDADCLLCHLDAEANDFVIDPVLDLTP